MAKKKEEITIEKARETLGPKYEHLTDKEVESIIAQMDLLARGWLDQREKQIFGKTIDELLKE